MRAFEDAFDARHPHGVDIALWSREEAAQVVALLESSLRAGPEVTARIVRLVVDLAPPGRAAVSRSLSVSQLISSAWTSAVQRATRAPAWWGTEPGRTMLAALAERCCLTGPLDDVDVLPALREAPSMSGSVPLDEVVTNLAPPGERAADGAELVLSFVLRATGGPTGVTWWPGPQEHVIGWPPPLPAVGDEVMAALGVPEADVYELHDDGFCPAPLLPIGHGPRALPDLARIDRAAHAVGTEVVTALGTLSSAGVQLVVRTTGPTAVFAAQPGIVNLTTSHDADALG
jgi:hypothetical protein